jgi:HEAT repeat protein
MMKVLVLLAVLLFLGCNARDQEYQGKPLSYWINALEDPTQRTEAGNLLAEISAKDNNVVPRLIQSVKNGSYAAAELLGRIGPVGDHTKHVVTALGDAVKTKAGGNVSQRRAAARALEKFGPAARDAVPALIEMLKDKDILVREQAAETLGKLPRDIARPAVPALKEVAESWTTDVGVRHKAMEALKQIDPDALLPVLPPIKLP